jgi:hypothetical protein
MLNVLDKYRKTTKYDENAQIILDAFIEQLFSGKFNDIISFEEMPKYSKRISSEELDDLMNKTKDDMEYFLKVKDVIIDNLLNKEINFNFKIKDESFKLEIYDEHTSRSIYLNKKVYHKENDYTEDKRLAALFNNQLSLSDSFFSFISNFNDFSNTYKEEIEYVYENSFIPNDIIKYHSFEAAKKTKSKLLRKKSTIKKPYIYNDLDNEAFFHEDENFEFICLKSQDLFLVHIFNKKEENIKILNYSDFIYFPDFKDNIISNCILDFKNNKNVLFDSNKGVNRKDDYCFHLREHFSCLSISDLL